MLEAAGYAEELGEVLEEGLVELALGGVAEVGDVVGDLDVAHGGEGGKQVEALEDEADAGAAHFGALGVGELGEVGALDGDGAGGSGGEATEDVEEGGLAGAGGAYDGDEFAWLDGEADVTEGGDFEFAGAVGLAEVLGDDDRLHVWLKSIVRGGDGMNVRELLLCGLMGWTVIGLTGTAVAWIRGRRGVPGEREKAVRGIGWLVGVWVVYLAVLVGVSLVQRQRVVAMGQEQCYDDMCFAVTGADEVPRFLGRNGIGDGSRLVRVTVSVRNKGRGKTQSEGLIRAYLVDGQGREWEESRGVNGNRLTAPVGPGETVVSEPVFKVAPDATGLGLVFTHGRWQPGVLVIGDSDSLWHRRTVVGLER